MRGLGIGSGRRIGRALCIAVCCAAVLLPVRTAAAWGLDGHRVTALLADRILQQSHPEARAKVLALLATDQDNRLTKTDIASEATPESWARETYAIAKSVTYSFAVEQPAGTHRFAARRGQKEPCGSAIPLYQVAPDYEEKALAAVRLQLTRGGVRLAAVLRDRFQ